MKVKNIISVIILVSCLVFGVSCDTGGDANDEVGDSSGADPAFEVGYADEIFAGINSRRESAGLSALIRDTDLDGLASDQNDNMISEATVYGVIVTGHDDYEDRFDASIGYGFTTGFGENTAGIRGYSRDVVVNTFIEGWVNSSGHYDNIVADFTHTGVSVTVDTRDGTIYATQIFAR